MIEENELFKKQFEKSQPKVKFNNGKCGKTCNCIEVAAMNNGGEPVKKYPCLGIPPEYVNKLMS